MAEENLRYTSLEDVFRQLAKEEGIKLTRRKEREPFQQDGKWGKRIEVIDEGERKGIRMHYITTTYKIDDKTNSEISVRIIQTDGLNTTVDIQNGVGEIVSINKNSSHRDVYDYTFLPTEKGYAKAADILRALFVRRPE